MVLTERKAITQIFENLQEEKRQKKQEYRNDMAQIESRENDLLNRLERLDSLEREAIDVEGVLHSMAHTADRLSELIPPVPAADMIERAAQLVAKEATESGAKIEMTEAAAAKEKKQTEIIQKEDRYKNYSQKRMRSYDYMEVVVDMIRSSPSKRMTGKEMEAEFKKRYNWEFTKFHQKLTYWKMMSPGVLARKGQSYYVKADQEQQQEPTDTQNKEVGPHAETGATI